MTAQDHLEQVLIWLNSQPKAKNHKQQRGTHYYTINGTDIRLSTKKLSPRGFNGVTICFTDNSNPQDCIDIIKAKTKIRGKDKPSKGTKRPEPSEDIREKLAQAVAKNHEYEHTIEKLREANNEARIKLTAAYAELEAIKMVTFSKADSTVLKPKPQLQPNRFKRFINNVISKFK